MFKWLCSHAGKIALGALAITAVVVTGIFTFGIPLFAGSIVGSVFGGLTLLSGGMYLGREQGVRNERAARQERLETARAGQVQMQGTAGAAAAANPQAELAQTAVLMAELQAQKAEIAVMKEQNRLRNEQDDAFKLSTTQRIDALSTTARAQQSFYRPVPGGETPGGAIPRAPRGLPGH